MSLGRAALKFSPIYGYAMRADLFFAEKFGSRTRAKDALRKGLVLRGGRPLSPSDEVHEGDEFIFISDGVHYVSRGGFKLERGLDAFGESVENKVFVDLGASAGGFTEVLLARGAARVYAVDVGEAQLAPSLVADPRVVVMDKTNARYLTADSFPEHPDGFVSDLSFISLRLILPMISSVLSAGGKAYVLFKPQFECGGKGLGKGGILPVKYHRQLLADFYAHALSLHLAPRAIVCAPVFPRKNVEYVILLEKDGKPLAPDSFLDAAENLY